jgi:capsule polysaccharide export protein KpsE/RkpR
MKERNTKLGYKGDWCEQTAEFAEACNDRETAERNYRRALEAYESGGWLERALKVARKLRYQEKIDEIEAKLK